MHVPRSRRVQKIVLAKAQFAILFYAFTCFFLAELKCHVMDPGTRCRVQIIKKLDKWLGKYVVIVSPSRPNFSLSSTRIDLVYQSDCSRRIANRLFFVSS